MPGPAGGTRGERRRAAPASSVPAASWRLGPWLPGSHLRAGETVLVRGAAGSIGIAAVELAARAGAGAVGVTTSSPERGKRLRSLGATHVLDRAGAGGEQAPDAFDVIIDIVGGPDLPSFIQRLAANGRLVAVGIVGGYPPADFGMPLDAAADAHRRMDAGEVFGRIVLAP